MQKSDRQYKVTDWVQDNNSCFVQKMKKKISRKLYKSMAEMMSMSLDKSRSKSQFHFLL